MPLSPATIRNYAYFLRFQLSLLIRDGVPIETFQTLGNCLQPDLVKQGLKLLQAGRPINETTYPMLWGTVNAWLSFAKFTGAPEALKADLARYLRRLRKQGARSRGLKKKNEERLAQFDDPRARRALLLLPLLIADELRSVKTPTRDQALRMRIAAMLELLIHMPIRMRNVVGLDLERHVQRVHTSEGVRWRIVIPEDEVKNGMEISANLPVDASEILEVWRTKFRPRLSPQCTRLFIGVKGRPIGEGPLSKAFSHLIMSDLGLQVNPHLMRHLAGKTLIRARPGHYEQVKQMLGHRNIATTINFYCGADTEAAFEQYDAIIRAERGLRSDDDEL